jgi:hypothetical protein
VQLDGRHAPFVHHSPGAHAGAAAAGGEFLQRPARGFLVQALYGVGDQLDRVAARYTGSVTTLVQERLAALPGICGRYGVRSLAVFGSAASDRFDPSRSDLDLLVEFRPMPPAQHADSYFGLWEELEHLFGVEVDLIEAAPIRNPYFLEEVQGTKETLYVAE